MLHDISDWDREDWGLLIQTEIFSIIFQKSNKKKFHKLHLSSIAKTSLFFLFLTQETDRKAQAQPLLFHSRLDFVDSRSTENFS